MIFNVQTQTVQDGNFEDQFDFDGLRGGNHEFKVDVPAGREECFYQFASKGATLFISYEVTIFRLSSPISKT